MGYVIVFLGGGIGAALRHGINIAAARALGTGFPYGTLIINIVGSLAMGVMAEYFALKGGLPQHVRLFLTTGILGGFTTFSAFSLEAALLYERGQLAGAALYVIASVVLAIAALFAGLAIVRALV
jgi:fluoride exporter